MSLAHKTPPLRDNAPPWMKERRRPTREELAGKHKADGGGMPPQVNTLPDDVVDDDCELVPLESDPTTFVRRPKAAAIKVRTFK